MNARREIIKNASLTVTGKVLGAMASRKTATASTEQPIAKSTPLSQSAKLLSGKVALVITPLYRSQGQLQSMGLDSFEKQDEVVGEALPLKSASALELQDIADTATFLASDRAKFISGEVVDVALGYNAAYTA